MAYTLHRELPDGTLEDAFGKAHAAKATAIRIAKDCAKSASIDATARIIVQDANEMTVAAFKVEC